MSPFLSLALLSAAFAPDSQTAVATPACNGQSRTLQIAAGTTPGGTQNCTSITFTITILGQSVTITTPSSCSTGSTVRSDDTFSCGPAAPLIHCTAEGFKVTVKVYSIANPCPTIPATLPTTLAAAQALTQCIPPALVSTVQTWSAKTKNCTTGTSNKLHAHMDVVTTPVDEYVVVESGLDTFLSAAAPNPVATWLTSHETGSLKDLPAELQRVEAAHSPIRGVTGLLATVTRDFLGQSGGSTVTNTFQLTGDVRADGTFSVENTFQATTEGNADVAVEDMTYDGATFFVGTQGDAYYNAYASTSTRQRAALSDQASFMDALRTWVRSPFGITHFPGTTYSSSGTGSVRTVTEAYPGMFSGGASGKTVYTLSMDPVAHPTAIDSYDASGNLVARWEYDAFGTIAPGVWRPYTIVEQRFVAGSNVPYMTQTTKIVNASVTSQDEAARPVTRRTSPEDMWFLRM